MDNPNINLDFDEVELFQQLSAGTTGKDDELISINARKRQQHSSQHSSQKSNHLLNSATSTSSRSKAEVLQMYDQLRKHYVNNNFIEIMFLLPTIAKFNMVPPIFNLIIGCSFIHFGRISSAFREIGFAVCMAPTEHKRKEFLKVLAYTYADLNKTEYVLGCLGEILDISRNNLVNTEDFENMKNEICGLEKELMQRLEMARINNKINKSKSFDDQILDLQIVDKVFPKTSFTGKCQVIVNKIHEADSILQIWNKERKPLKSNLFKLLVEAIFVLGPDIAYYHMFKMEPLMNQYFEFLNNQPLQPKQKKHTVSTFFAGKTTTVSNAHAWQVKLIKGFIAMLRHEYKEAADLFAESVEIYSNDIDSNSNNNGNNSDNSDNNSSNNSSNNSNNSNNNSDINNTINKCNLDFSSKTAFLGCLCQANEANQSKKQLEVLAIKISNSPFNSALKYQVLAKVYHKLHVLEKQKTRKSILKTFKPNNRDMALKCYISAATLAEEDNLLIAEYYDNILNFLVGEIRECIGSSRNTGKGNNKAHNHLRMRYLVFFYQIRNLFCLYSDYNYLHIPGLVCDWQVVKQDEKILNKIQQYVDGTNEISDDEEEEEEENEDDDGNDENDDNSTVPRDTTMRSIRSTPKSANKSEMPPDKSLDLIDYWVKEYQTYKGEIPDAVKKFMPS